MPNSHEHDRLPRLSLPFRQPLRPCVELWVIVKLKNNLSASRDPCGEGRMLHHVSVELDAEKGVSLFISVHRAFLRRNWSQYRDQFLLMSSCASVIASATGSPIGFLVLRVGVS
jgi:hypothetical protein